MRRNQPELSNEERYKRAFERGGSVLCNGQICRNADELKEAQAEAPALDPRAGAPTQPVTPAPRVPFSEGRKKAGE